MVEAAWKGDDRPISNPFQRVAGRLRHTARRLKSWSDKFIGNVKLQILVATEVILWLDVAMEARSLTVAKRGLRSLLKKKLLGLSSLEHTIVGNALVSCGSRKGMRIHAFFILAPFIGSVTTILLRWVMKEP